MSEKVQSGGCQCGAVRFKTTSSPKRVLACHCATCKQRTGSPFGVGLYFAEEDVEFTQGTLNAFEFHSDTSGRWLRNEFCDRCGTAVSWTLEMRPGLRAIAGGAFDDPHWYRIEAHIWTSSARPDMRYPEDMPVYEKGFGK